LWQVKSKVFDSLRAGPTWLCSDAKESSGAAGAATSLQAIGPAGLSPRIQHRLQKKFSYGNKERNELPSRN
jgi:hypothetical protein